MGKPIIWTTNFFEEHDIDPVHFFTLLAGWISEEAPLRDPQTAITTVSRTYKGKGYQYRIDFTINHILNLRVINVEKLLHSRTWTPLLSVIYRNKEYSTITEKNSRVHFVPLAQLFKELGDESYSD